MTDTVDAPRRHQQVVNLDELPASIGGKGPRFAFMRKQLGAAAGAQQLGVSFMELPPGARAWPRHYHAANEEGLYILEGRGLVRLGEVDAAREFTDWFAGHIFDSGKVPSCVSTTCRPTAAAPLPTSTTCLLYTSPSPRDRTRSRMPSSA